MPAHCLWMKSDASGRAIDSDKSWIFFLPKIPVHSTAPISSDIFGVHSAYLCTNSSKDSFPDFQCLSFSKLRGRIVFLSVAFIRCPASFPGRFARTARLFGRGHFCPSPPHQQEIAQEQCAFEQKGGGRYLVLQRWIFCIRNGQAQHQRRVAEGHDEGREDPPLSQFPQNDGG